MVETLKTNHWSKLLSRRALRALEAADITTMEDFMSFDANKLKDQKRIGISTVQEVGHVQDRLRESSAIGNGDPIQTGAFLSQPIRTPSGALPPQADGNAVMWLLPKAYAKIGAVVKGHQHQQRWSYRSVDDALNALNPILAELGLTITPKCSKHKLEVRPLEQRDGTTKLLSQATLKMKLQISAFDGSCTTVSAIGEAWDWSGDKATSKAMSQAFKYCVFLGFCIPTDPNARQPVLPDADQESFEMPVIEHPLVVQARSLIKRAKTEEEYHLLEERIERSEVIPKASREELLMLLEGRRKFTSPGTEDTDGDNASTDRQSEDN